FLLDTRPPPTAAASVDKPIAIAVQNRRRSSRLATGGRPGDRNAPVPTDLIASSECPSRPPSYGRCGNFESLPNMLRAPISISSPRSVPSVRRADGVLLRQRAHGELLPHAQSGTRPTAPLDDTR